MFLSNDDNDDNDDFPFCGKRATRATRRESNTNMKWLQSQVVYHTLTIHLPYTYRVSNVSQSQSILRRIKSVRVVVVLSTIDFCVYSMIVRALSFFVRQTTTILCFVWDSVIRDRG